MRSDPDVVAVKNGGMPRLARTKTGLAAAAPAPSLGCVLHSAWLPSWLPAVLDCGGLIVPVCWGCEAGCSCCCARASGSSRAYRSQAARLNGPCLAHKAPTLQSRCALCPAAPPAVCAAAPPAACAALCVQPSGGRCADAAAGAPRSRRRLLAAGLLRAQHWQPGSLCHVERQ